MLPGSRDSQPDTVSGFPSNQQQWFLGCCDWLEKICERFISTSSNNNIEHPSDYCDGRQYSSACTHRQDFLGYGNQWKRDGGGRFFACTGSLLVAADCSSKVATNLDPLGKKNKEQVCFEYLRKNAEANGSGRIGKMDSTIPGDGSFVSANHDDFECGNNYTNRNLMQHQRGFLGFSSTGKNCRSATDPNSNSPRKTDVGIVKSYESMLSSPRFRSVILLETCSRSFLKDFKVWDETSSWVLSQQKVFVSNDKQSSAKEPVHFDIQGLCTNILEQADRDSTVAFICSKLARHGYWSVGRGAVTLLFKTSEKVDQFIVPDFRVASFSYVCLSDLPASSVWPGNPQSKFAHLCQLYNPECQYIFSVTVDGCEEVRCNPLSVQCKDETSHMDGELVARLYAKLPVYILRSLNLSLDINDPGATLILTPVPGSRLSEYGGEHRAREICFTNIQQKLRQRGISLQHQFPEIYRRLCAYAENNVRFVPVSLFLSDSKTGKKFLCLIMPNSEPFCYWMEELFEHLESETIV